MVVHVSLSRSRLRQQLPHPRPRRRAAHRVRAGAAENPCRPLQPSDASSSVRCSTPPMRPTAGYAGASSSCSMRSPASAWACSNRPAMPAANTASPCCCSTSRSANSSASGAARASRPGTTQPRGRLFAALQDPDTARALSAMCGEYAVVATAQGTAPAARAAAPDLAPVPPADRRTAPRFAAPWNKPEEITQDTR